MGLYSGAYLYLKENNKWWLVRGLSSDLIVSVDTRTGKTIDNPSSLEEPWQVPAIAGMPTFYDIQVPIKRILDEDIFEIEQAEIIDEQEDSYGLGLQAVVHIKVKSLQNSEHHIATTREYKLFSHDELLDMTEKLGEGYLKPLFIGMLSLDNGTFRPNKK